MSQCRDYSYSLNQTLVVTEDTMNSLNAVITAIL